MRERNLIFFDRSFKVYLGFYLKGVIRFDTIMTLVSFARHMGILMEQESIAYYDMAYDYQDKYYRGLDSKAPKSFMGAAPSGAAPSNRKMKQ